MRNMYAWTMHLIMRPLGKTNGLPTGACPSRPRRRIRMQQACLSSLKQGHGVEGDKLQCD